MFFSAPISSYARKIEREIAELEKRIAAMPEGSLQVSRNGDYYTWRVVYPDKSRVYLNKDEIETARALAEKKHAQARLADLKAEWSACRKYLCCAGKTDNEEKLLRTSGPEFRRLLNTDPRTKDERIAAWENAPYLKSSRYPEQLKHPTLKPDEFVRSKFEADTARNLYMLSIPYRYENIITIGNIQIAADFIALDIRNFREIVIELFGMMDNPDYRKMHDKKLQTYIAGGFIPGVNMLTFYETQRTPSNPIQTREILEDFFHRNPPILL